MHYISGSLLSTIFSAVIIVGQGMMPPEDHTSSIQQLTPVVQPVRQAFTDAHMKECMMERRRMLYEARSNTLIMTNIASASHQEVAMGLKL